MLESARRLADLEGAPRVEIDTGRGLLGQGASGVGGSAGVGRRAVPRVPPGHLHDQRPDQARQPQERAGAARGRALGGRGRRASGFRCAAVSNRRTRRDLEAAAPQPVPRHHPGIQHSLGERRLPARPQPDRECDIRVDRACTTGGRESDRHGRHDAALCRVQRRVSWSARSDRDRGARATPCSCPSTCLRVDTRRSTPMRCRHRACRRCSSPINGSKTSCCAWRGIPTVSSRRCSTRSTTVRCSRPARAATCSSSTTTTRKSSTRGTSTSTTSTHAPTSRRSRRSPLSRVTRSVVQCDSCASSAHRRSHRRCGSRADRAASSSSPRSTGTSATSS